MAISNVDFDTVNSGNPISKTDFDPVITSAELDIHALTAKTTPVDADETVIADSAASYANKKVTWTNIKATLKTYYDAVTSTLTNKSISGSTNTLTNIGQSSVTNLTTDLAGKEATANKDASGGYAGLTLFKINFKNAANTFTSFFTNTNTAARTYTFQDRNGTILDGTNLVTGSTDNAILRADGTGGVTTQSSGVTIDDSNNIVLPTTITGTSGIIYKGSVRFIHNYLPAYSGASGKNIFIGLGTGNFTMNGTSFTYEAGANVGVGDGALVSLTTGYQNGAFGINSLSNVTSGFNNFGMGTNTLTRVTTGSQNVAIGSVAGQFNSGTANMFIGGQSGKGVDGSSNSGGNVGVGYQTLVSLTSSSGLNVALGYRANIIGTTGSGNIIIGANCDPSANNASNELNIGNVIYGTGLYGTGKIGINTGAAPNSSLQVTGSLALSYIAKTGAYTLTATDYLVNCTSGTYAITLPTAASITGRIYVINNSGTGVITINTTSSQTINGSASGTITLAQYHSITVFSDGANWITIATT